MSVTLAGRRAICFFAADGRALEFAEHNAGGEPGVDWIMVAAEDPDALLRIADGASGRGFDGWVLDPPLEVPDKYPLSTWSELRDEVERKLQVGAAWGSPPPSLREIPQDPQTVALSELLPSAIDVLQGLSSPY